MGEQAFVFGYGSLTLLAGVSPSRAYAASGFVADLPGVERWWGVAMDNRRDLPGYKHYLDRDGTRPDVFVAFLDIRDHPGGCVNGLCLPVDPARLAVLDTRERNYERVEISSRVTAAVAGATVWTYVGTEHGRARLAEGRRRGNAVIDAGYLRTVRDGFRALGAGEYERAAPSLEVGGLPVRELRRIDRPPRRPV